MCVHSVVSQVKFDLFTESSDEFRPTPVVHTALKITLPHECEEQVGEH